MGFWGVANSGNHLGCVGGKSVDFLVLRGGARTGVASVNRVVDVDQILYFGIGSKKILKVGDGVGWCVDVIKLLVSRHVTIFFLFLCH